MLLRVIYRSLVFPRNTSSLFNVADLIAVSLTNFIYSRTGLNLTTLQYVTAHDNLYVLFFNFMLGKRVCSRLPCARPCGRQWLTSDRRPQYTQTLS